MGQCSSLRFCSLYAGFSSSLWVPLARCFPGRTRSRKRRRSIPSARLRVASQLFARITLDEHLSIPEQSITLISPNNLASGKTGTPHKEAHEIPDGIQPAEPERLDIAHNAPAGRNRLDHAIDVSPSQ